MFFHALIFKALSRVSEDYERFPDEKCFKLPQEIGVKPKNEKE